MIEEWKFVPNTDNLYSVSTFGRLRSNARIDAKGVPRKERVLILGRNIDGYLKGNFFICGKQSHKFMHRIVYESFHGPIPDGLEINHKNGIRDDNRPENLEAVTHGENMSHSKNTLCADYATYGNGRMTPEQRERVFAMREQGFSFRNIGLELGFSKNQIDNVYNKRCWNV